MRKWRTWAQFLSSVSLQMPTHNLVLRFQSDLSLRRILLLNRETRVRLTAIEESHGIKVFVYCLSLAYVRPPCAAPAADHKKRRLACAHRHVLPCNILPEVSRDASILRIVHIPAEKSAAGEFVPTW
jgi:hypothetical protein